MPVLSAETQPLYDLIHEPKISEEERIARVGALVRNIRPSTLLPLLPLLLNLEGKPFTLQNHFPFEPVFRTRLPRKSVWRCGRQTGKSRSLAAQGIVMSTSIPYLNSLYITPLYEMIRRFSVNYLRPFIEESSLRELLVGTRGDGSVLQRTFRNGSQLLCSYASLDVTRVRSASMDRCVIDEAQSFNPDFGPVVEETMSGRPNWANMTVSGTALTTSTMLEKWWRSSSQAEWCIRCDACTHWNIPSKEFDLDKMIGEHTDVSEEKPGTICAKCRKPIFSRRGRWVHRYHKLRWDFAGYHVSQIVMPLHYALSDRWKRLLGKSRGQDGYTPTRYYNEVHGESMDEGSGLVTETELIKAGTLHENTKEKALATIRQYQHRVLGVDWGGGGKSETSFTCLAVLGLRPDGKVDVIYGERLPNPFDQLGEAKRAHQLFREFRCLRLAHDYTGAGALRETFLLQDGINRLAVVPIAYVMAARSSLLKFMPATRQHPRARFHMDKPRSLLLTCACLKLGILRSFKYDYMDHDNPGLMHDFLALKENKVERRMAGEVYTVQRHASMTDDFAQAVNIGLITLFHLSGQWPDVASTIRMLDLGEENLDEDWDSYPAEPGDES